jgi:hypothetical protein
MALYLVDQSPRPARTLVIGAAGLLRELRDVGLEVVLSTEARSGGEQTAAVMCRTLGSL